MKGHVDIPLISLSLLPAWPAPSRVPASGLPLAQFLWRPMHQSLVELGLKLTGCRLWDVLGIWLL